MTIRSAPLPDDESDNTYPTPFEDLWLTEQTARAYPEPWPTVVPRPDPGPSPLAGQQPLPY